MNKPPSRHDPLLDELLAGAEADPLRASSLTHLLAAARRTRRRQALRGAALALVPLLAALVLLGRNLSLPKSSTRALGPGRAAVLAPEDNTSLLAPVSSAPRGLRIVSDKELLALFPDRPVALVGPPGRQRLVFLDQQKTPDGGRTTDGLVD